MRIFKPCRLETFPNGESAVERVFAHIARFDPDLTCFNVLLFRSPKPQPRSGADPVLCFRQRQSNETPAAQPAQRRYAENLPPKNDDPVPRHRWFDRTNPDEVVAFLKAVNEAEAGRSEWWTYAVCVVFTAADLEPSAPGVLPKRLFARAPFVRSACLIFCSGSCLGSFDGRECSRFLGCFGEGMGVGDAEPVATETLLPYLQMPRSTLDPVPDSAFFIGAADEGTEYWKNRILNEGVTVTSSAGSFGVSELRQLRLRLWGMYVAWVEAGVEWQVTAQGALIPFARTRNFMRGRFHQFRDFLNAAVCPVARTTPPNWATCSHDPLRVPTASNGKRFNNYLFAAARDGYHAVTAALMRGDSATQSARARECQHLLREQGMLSAILTLVGDVECQRIVP